MLSVVCFPLLSIFFVSHLWMLDVIIVVKEVGNVAEITTRANKTVRPSSNS